jgi:hypothetical protein
MKWKIVAVVALAAGTSTTASAQQGPPASSAVSPAPGTVDSAAVSRTAREQQEGYNRVVNEGVKITNADDEGTGKIRKRGPAAATADDIQLGAGVRDSKGLQVATIDRIEADGAVVRAGDRLAKLPLHAFGKDDQGLLIGLTADEFRAAIAATSIPVPQEVRIVDATAADMTPGAAVRDSEGVAIGTVDSLAEDGVVVLTGGKKVKLAIASFAKDDQGLLIGITVNEFNAIISGSARTGAGS